MKSNPKLVWGEKAVIVKLIKEEIKRIEENEMANVRLQNLKSAYEKLRLNQWNFKIEDTCARCQNWKSNKISKHTKKTMTEILAIPKDKTIKPFIALVELYGMDPKEYVKNLNEKGGLYYEMTNGRGEGDYHLLKDIKTYQIKPKK